MGRPFLFCCPITGQNVQGSADADDPSDGKRRYVSVHCLACHRVHIVNPVTGKLLSEEIDKK